MKRRDSVSQTGQKHKHRVVAQVDNSAYVAFAPQLLVRNSQLIGRPHLTYLSGVERGVRNATVLVLGNLAKTLGVEVEEPVRISKEGK
jgi:hypothetical protein